MNALITAAEAALTDLKSRHHSMSQSCPGPAHCPTAAAIANLEVEIARAKREGPWWKQKVTVCDKCFQATCWQGIFMCQQSYEAGTVDKTIAELIALNTGEHPDHWTTTDAAKDALPGTQDDPEFQAVAGFDPKEHLPVIINPPA